MGSFLTTCFKSLSVHSLFSKSKASLTRENTKTRLSLLLCKDVFWASICSASVWKLSCHAAWKHPFSAPTGLQVFTKAGPQLKSQGNSRYWPVAEDVLAYLQVLLLLMQLWGPPCSVVPGEDLFAHPEYLSPWAVRSLQSF